MRKAITRSKSSVAGTLRPQFLLTAPANRHASAAPLNQRELRLPIRIGKNPRVSPQDCDLAGQAALRRGNGFGILARNQHREPLFVQNSRRGEPDAAGAARNEGGRP
jgi:hypothetical protein